MTGRGAGVCALRAGESVRLDRSCSPQLVRPVVVRVIRVLDRPTYPGWVWMEGYELDASGDALRRRQLFIRQDGTRSLMSGRG